jgi:hypothetical protein
VENFAVRYHVDDRTLVIYASNVSEFHDPVYPVPAIERMLTGEAVEMPPQVVGLTGQQLANYEGRYVAASGAILSVEAKEPFLKLNGQGQEAFSLITSRKWEKDTKLEAFNEHSGGSRKQSNAQIRGFAEIIWS